MSTSDMKKNNECNDQIRFKIDGQKFTTTDAEQPAADLLRLAGLDPEHFDLGQRHRGASVSTKLFDDTETVHIEDGDRFVSIRECAPVA